MDDGAHTFDRVVDRLAKQYAPVRRGVVERIMLEEHDLLTGLQPGDIVSPVLIEATMERLERLREPGSRAEPA